MGGRVRHVWRAVTAPRSTGGRAALLATTLSIAGFVPALSYVAAAGEGGALVGTWNHYPTNIRASGYVVTELGCAQARSAAALDRMFRDRVGPILGLDNAHVIPLGGQNFLWLFNDVFLDYTNRGTTINGAVFIRNAAVLQQRDCFSLVRRGDKRRMLSFEPGDLLAPDADGREDRFWPLGGEVHDRRLTIFWAEMENDDPPPAGDGIKRHPVRTWIGTYDVASLERLDLRPAKNDGVFPQYGFAVASDDEHTYLFGNSNLLNLTFEGGFYNGPHSATKMFLARVPLGDLSAALEYRTADGWSRRANDAVPISERFWTDNGMQPRYLDGHWLAVTKIDGFWGTETIVETARDPWGPWTIVSKRTITPFRGFDVMNNYQPIILPYRGPSGDLIIVMAQNARNWNDAVDDPSMYRLSVYREPWPFRESAN